MRGLERTLYSAIESMPPTMVRSPRHASGGASPSPAASASATPPIATDTPNVLGP